jgi:ribose 5-phosphate isomerase A
MEQDRLKKAAALRAAQWIEDGMVIGLGTGSTVRFLLEHIGERRAAGEWKNIRCIPTSADTERKAQSLGIPLTSLEAEPIVDLTIDGADEVDPELRLIKGMGGALLREKIVATASRRLVIMVDESKCVERLGTRSPLPVEIDPFALGAIRPFIESLGAEVRLRVDGEGQGVRTDGGHLVLDCVFAGGIDDAHELDRRLLLRSGVLETGLFLDLADAVVVAGAGGIEVRMRPGVEEAR